MKTSFNRRLSLITFVLIGTGVLLLARLASFQFQLDMQTYLQNVAANKYTNYTDRIPERGRIFDRNGELLAGNTTEYVIGISPNYVLNKTKTAHDLAVALGDDEARILPLVSGSAKYQRLTPQPVTTDVAQKVARLSIPGVVINAEPKRIYPQNSLAAHVIGFVGWDGSIRRGYVGVEGGYNEDLAGQSRVIGESRIPFASDSDEAPKPGNDVILTIDRRIQYLAETELQDAIDRYGAISGSIIIMDPRTGEILAMASLPTFDPNQYYAVEPQLMKNPVVSDPYEPGSVFKIVTASLALESGRVTLDSTYYDEKKVTVGGRDIYNWDRLGHGSQTFSDILIKSLNVGTTWLSTEVMKASYFYPGMTKFGVGSATGIDLEGENPGDLRKPGDTYWSDSDLATHSFGQGLLVTPLQMLCYANTIANGGQMMQPHVRLDTVADGKIIESIPTSIRNPISAKTAKEMTDIMVRVVNEGEGKDARVSGYTIAGKTGTAQIYCETCPPLFYEPELQTATFAGFLPADEPRVSVLIKLDKVSSYASKSAAPAFSKLVKRLVVLMNIPTDAQRQALKAQGGNTAMIAVR